MGVSLADEGVVQRVQSHLDKNVRHVLRIIVWNIARVPDYHPELVIFFWDALDIPNHRVFLQLACLASLVLNGMNFHPEVDVSYLLATVSLNNLSSLNGLAFHDPVSLIIESFLQIDGGFPYHIV